LWSSRPSKRWRAERQKPRPLQIASTVSLEDTRECQKTNCCNNWSTNSKRRFRNKSSTKRRCRRTRTGKFNITMWSNIHDIFVFNRQNDPRYEFTMQHFFRSLPFAPYAYNYHPDGCEVGKYTPEYRFVKKRTQTVTADRFKDPRQHKHPA